MLATSFASRGVSKEVVHSLDESERETTKLIPTKRNEHHVWVQGRLAKVRTVSTANLRTHQSCVMSSSGRVNGGTNIELAVGSTSMPSQHRRRRSSMGDVSDRNTNSMTRTTYGSVQSRSENRNLRGYGIGGAGNIRMALTIFAN